MIYFTYLWSLLRHKWYVYVAGRLCRVPVWRLIVHDWSKFTPVEFIRYARYLFSGNKDRREWAAAWHHHAHHNAHHPEFWLLPWNGQPDFYDGIGSPVAKYIVALPMPEVCVRELVADHLGASKARTGSWDASEWFNENGEKWSLHPDTAWVLRSIMHEIGFVLERESDWWSWATGARFRKWAEGH